MSLKDYIRGQRRGKEANRLERKAMDDPFLQEAIDGYDSVEGNHISAIEDLEKRLSSQKHINKRLWLWVAAAVIVLLIGTPLLLYKPYMPEDIPVISSDIIQIEEEIIPSLVQKDTVLLADHPELNKKEDTAPKVKQTTSPFLPEEASPENIELIAENIEVAEDVKDIADKEIRLSTAQHIREKTIIGEPLSTSITPSDKIFVSGRIVDETGEPIPGVTIQLPNTPTGTVSDTAGNFQLIVPKDKQETLIASYLGMKKSKIPLKENAGDIMMESDDMALNEVVVTGYGVRKKRLFTGSVSSVKDREAFGEEEFRNYFTENYDKDICAGQDITIVVEFFIDPVGRPGHIDIKENSCPALENEIKRLLLGSPPWSKINRKVTLQIGLPQ